MSDPHDREPVDQATIDGWRVNYGLDKRTPADAARYWADRCAGMAPAGAVAALGIALDDLDALRKDAEEAVRSSVAAAVTAERERCAKLLDAAHEKRRNLDNHAAFYARMIRMADA